MEKMPPEHKHHLAEQKRHIQLPKVYMFAIQSVNTNLQNLETIEYNEMLEWVNSLQPASAIHWGCGCGGTCLHPSPWEAEACQSL